MSNNALPIGTVYETRDKDFNPNTTKNNLFVGKWEKMEGYSFGTNAGSPQIRYNGSNDVVGSNSQNLRIDWQHYHEQFTGLPVSFAEIDGNTGTASSTVVNPAHKAATTARADRVSVNGFVRNTKNSGIQTNTQTFDNRPFSFIVTKWVRVS